jgi:hypothetical protein
MQKSMNKPVFEKLIFPFATGGNLYEWETAETTITVPKNGKYFIAITASAKNSEQNGTGDDDDLKISINDYEYGKKESHAEKISYQGFGTSAAWDGASLKGQEETIYFFGELYLNEKYVLKFFADGTPVIKSIKVYEVIGNYFDLNPEEIKTIPTQKKGIPWKSFVFAGIRPEKVIVYANCKSGMQKATTDGDNVKIILNGSIIQNIIAPSSKKYKNFYFSGDIDKGITQKLQIDKNFGNYENAIEIWCDESPIVGSIEIFILGVSDFRKKSIIENTKAEFIIEENLSADGGKPIYELASQEQVSENEQFIIVSAQKYKLDPDFVRAIIYMESTHGYYDKFCDLNTPLCRVGENKSILPMNIYVRYWEGLGFIREDLENPAKNIDAGCLILQRIWERVKNPTIRKVASIYQILSSLEVTDYGARVQNIYEQKLWLKK